MSALRIALIASARYPIAEPFAGGLEAQTWALAMGLRRRGHEVSLFAAPGSDPVLGARHLEVRQAQISSAALADISTPSSEFLIEHHAYLGLMLELMADRGRRYDLVHNNSLHHLPVAMARALSVPVVTTLHTPPTAWLESAIAAGPCPVQFVAVSRWTAAAWRHAVGDVSVVLNGVDLDTWRPGVGGGPLVWFGRIVPEKGPDFAARAAREAGCELLLVGPRPDPAFFRNEVAPLLGDGVEYLGHLDSAQLVELVGRAEGTLITPRWDEPYGLTAAESLACGTPVLGFARGGLTEVVDADSAALVPPDDITALVEAIGRRHTLDRAAARRRAVEHCSLDRMIDRYEQLYLDLVGGLAA